MSGDRLMVGGEDATQAPKGPPGRPGERVSSYVWTALALAVAVTVVGR